MRWKHRQAEGKTNVADCCEQPLNATGSSDLQEPPPLQLILRKCEQKDHQQVPPAWLRQSCPRIAEAWILLQDVKNTISRAQARQSNRFGKLR